MIKNLLFAATAFVALSMSANAQAVFELTAEDVLGGGSFYGSMDFSETELPSNDLVSITVDLTLESTVGDTYANDFAVIITQNNSLSAPGTLYYQIGGFSNFGAETKVDWTTGDSGAVGTTLSETFTFDAPFDITGGYLWIGNGYANANPPTNSASWSGTVTFNFDTDGSTENFSKLGLNVFPNPVSDIVNITSPEANIEMVTITDLNGRTVKSINFNNVAETTIDASDLASGIYLMNITANGTVATQKIVKK